eukprot:snap_masked-scaffold_133-processed-gene-0.6-mRNA-1 protein AED:1.00 eAED:1.00 QI:0/-1/0/0/-1/1/1/0/91
MGPTDSGSPLSSITVDEFFSKNLNQFTRFSVNNDTSSMPNHGETGGRERFSPPKNLKLVSLEREKLREAVPKMEVILRRARVAAADVSTTD